MKGKLKKTSKFAEKALYIKLEPREIKIKRISKYFFWTSSPKFLYKPNINIEFNRLKLIKYTK